MVAKPRAGSGARMAVPPNASRGARAAAGRRREKRARAAHPPAAHRALREPRLERPARRGVARDRQRGRGLPRRRRDARPARRGRGAHALHRALLSHRRNAGAAARFARLARDRSDERRRAADQPARRELKTGPVTNREMIARSLAAVWHPCTQMKSHERFPLVPIARGEGAWLVDFDGRRYLDAVSSWWVNLFGHAHPAINKAIVDQLGALEHVMLAGFTHAPVVELAERLARIAPRGLGHAFFASDGASASEIALKMAAHYWANRGERGKTKFVALQGGYHGETLGALGVTDVAIFRDAYAPLVREAFIAPFPARSADDHRFGGIKGAVHAADDLARLLEAHHAEIAALIVEPLV